MPRPNILLLHTDQQRFDTIAALGAHHMRTPAMDRLVDSGTAFTRAYSVNPVCMPARHDLITGTSARYHGYYHNQNTPIADYALDTLPRLLTAAGYQTLAVGKMHFHPEREHHGFSHMFLMEELPTSRENDAYLQYLERVGYGHVRCQHGVRPLFYHTPQVSQVPEEHHGSAWVATKTIELIRQPRENPFFIFASWVGPHPPYYQPKEYLDLYADQPVPAPCPAPGGDDRHAPESPENPPLEDQRMQRVREAYYGATTLIDTHIGRILDALAETGQLENTLVLLTADHGEMLGDRGCYQKHVPYEGSAHIPLVASGPGFAAGELVDVPVNTWDVSATILEAAGIDAPDGPPLLGASLSGEATRDPERAVVFHHAEGRGRYVAAVGHGHKLVHWYNGGDEELYDLEHDPWEQENLIGEQDDVADALRQAAIAFERDHGVAENVQNDAFVDLDYQAPSPHFCSLYPQWSYRQFPRWMVDMSQRDLDAIAQQMFDCLKADVLLIPDDPAWRADAIAYWESLGGDPAVYERIFAEVDARHSEEG